MPNKQNDKEISIVDEAEEFLLANKVYHVYTEKISIRPTDGIIVMRLYVLELRKSIIVTQQIK